MSPLPAAGMRPDSRPREERQGGAGDRGGDQSIPLTRCGGRSLLLESQGALPIGEPGRCWVLLSPAAPHLRLLLFRGDTHVLTDSDSVPGRTGRKAQLMEMEQRVMQLEPQEEVSPVTSKQAANGLLQGTPCHNLNQDRTRRGGRPRAAREDSEATSPPSSQQPTIVRQSCNVRLVACTRMSASPELGVSLEESLSLPKESLGLILQLTACLATK